MFLAIREIKHEKLRYSLISLMIFLIGYLIFVLASLAVGLARENTEAVDGWQMQQIVLNKNANLSVNQSLLTKKDLAGIKLGKKEAEIAAAGVLVKKKQRPTTSAQFAGIKKKQFIYQEQELVSGRKAQKENELTADQGLYNDGYRLGDKVSLNGSKKEYTIVGFVKQAKLNVAPLIYGNIKIWQKIRLPLPNVRYSAIVSQRKNFSWKKHQAQTYNKKQFINKLPGYTAQNATFGMMIGFLFIISLIVIAVFLYILTIQKKKNFAVMRAQGIPGRTIVGATVSQAIILVIIAIVFSLIAMVITAKIIPAAVPFTFTPEIALMGAVGLLLMGIIGSLIPIRTILKIDPVTAIGE